MVDTGLNFILVDILFRTSKFKHNTEFYSNKKMKFTKRKVDSNMVRFTHFLRYLELLYDV